MKFRIAMTCRFKWRRIQNGEKVIFDKGPAEMDVELSEEEIKGESSWEKVNRIFDQFERSLSRQERAEVRKLLRSKK